MKNLLFRFWADERGQDLAEYALLVAFISIAGVVLLESMNSRIENVWEEVDKALGKK